MVTQYQRVLLPETIEGEPGLPDFLVGLHPSTLADLSQLNPCPETCVGYGYLPIFPADPIPPGKVSTGATVEWVAGAPKWVHTLVDAPIVYKALTKTEILDHFHVALDPDWTMTREDAMFADPNMSGARRRFELAVPPISREHPHVTGFLEAMVEHSHVTQTEADTIYNNWPVE